MEATKKYTVITGASSGIGRETAKAFAGRGKNLIVAARRTENLKALKREILEQHPTRSKSALLIMASWVFSTVNHSSLGL